MKKSLKLAAVFFAATALLFTACKPDTPTDPEGGLEALIRSIEITNGGISGGELIKGTVDAEAFTVVFDAVPAETNIAAVKLSAKCSLGAYLEEETVDFTKGNEPDAKTLKHDLKVINKATDKGKEVIVEKVYSVTINLKDPVSAPVLEKMVLKDANGTEHTITAANILGDLLCLGMPESATAEIVSVVLSPVRGTYHFTAAKDGIISAADPGQLELEFMGLKSLFFVSFAASPAPGADWSRAVIHDFSIVTSNRYPDFDEEYTRGGDFDGKYLLLANAFAPKLFRLEDLLNDNSSNPILLSTTGIEGEYVAGHYFPVSAGRLTQGHIYLCCLATKVNDIEGGNGPFRVYHYASPEADPEIVLTWDGTGLENPDPEEYDEYFYAGRIGDNMSISLDESGNGYAFFFKQEADNKFFRWTVRNFNEFSELTELALPAIANYYAAMNPVGPNQYLCKSHHKEMMWLLDRDGKKLQEVEWAWSSCGKPSRYGIDPRVIEFNRARYLMLSNGRQNAWEPAEGINVWDITEGQDILSAMVKLQYHLDYDEDEPEEDQTPIDPSFQYYMDTEGLVEKYNSCIGLCNCAIVDGKLVFYTAAPRAGFAVIEVPPMID